MWLKSIELENIKCFENSKLVFTQNQNEREDKPYRWITLLGENGTGKSTLLQAIGLLLAGPEGAKELMPRPAGWVRDASKPGKIKAVIHREEEDAGNFGDEGGKRRDNFSYAYFMTGNKPVEVHVSASQQSKKREIYTEPAIIEEQSHNLSWLRTNAFASNSKGWFAAGYGPFRRLTREYQILMPSLSLPTRSSNFITQFNDNEPLSTFERWMFYLDFRLAKDPTDLKAQKMLAIGEKAITSLLPGEVDIQRVTKDGFVLFKLGEQIIPTSGMSDGYRSIIALAGDLIWRLLLTFPETDPAEASGVVLIDELDIHLHPVWQRQIAQWLQKIFPNLQFIIATHSPLIAVGAGREALTIRLLNNNFNQVSLEIIPDISLYDVDQALKSSAFDLVSTYSPQIQEKIEQYHQLRKSQGLTEEQQELYQELAGLMKRLNFYKDDDDNQELMKRITQFLEKKIP